MTLLYLNSDQMGQGEPELGRKLMENFLEKLADSDVPVDAVGCVNSGVMLTTGEGPALYSLRALERKGARIMSCGTCLEFYGRSDALQVGAVGNMEQSVQAMATADKVIRPN